MRRRPLPGGEPVCAASRHRGFPRAVRAEFAGYPARRNWYQASRRRRSTPAARSAAAAHAARTPRPAHGLTVRAAAGSVLYLALVGLLSLGIATIVRDSAAAAGAVLGILYVPPVIALFLGSEPTWQRWVERYTQIGRAHV